MPCDCVSFEALLYIIEIMVEIIGGNKYYVTVSVDLSHDIYVRMPDSKITYDMYVTSVTRLLNEGSIDKKSYLSMINIVKK